MLTWLVEKNVIVEQAGGNGSPTSDKGKHQKLPRIS